MFLRIIPDESRLFDPHVAQCDAQSLVIYLNACPLREAWETLALDDHAKAVMYEIAEKIDKSTFKSVGFLFEPDT